MQESPQNGMVGLVRKSVSFHGDDEEFSPMPNGSPLPTEWDAFSPTGSEHGIPESSFPEPFSPDPEAPPPPAPAPAPAAAAAAAPALPLRKDFNDWCVGNRYDLTKIVGSGSYGKVAEAYDHGKGSFPGRRSGPGHRVAIKQRTNIFAQLKESRQMFRELYILRRLNGSNQVIKLLDAMSDDRSAFRDLYLVFEWADMVLSFVFIAPRINKS